MCKRPHTSNLHNRLTDTPTLSLCGNLLSTTNGSNSSTNSNELSNSTLSSTNFSFQTNQINAMKSPIQPIPINYDNQNLNDSDLVLINSNSHTLINGNDQIDNLQFYANNLNGHQLHPIHTLHPPIDQTQQTHFNQQLNNAQIENFNTCNLANNNFISLNTDY